MKKLILTTSLVAAVTASSFAQGVVSFKTTSASKVYSATDGTTATLALVPTTGTVGSFGTVDYEIYAAPTGTAAPSLSAGVLSFGAGWTAEAIPGPIPYASAGTVTPAVTITLPSQAGAAGSSVEVEIVAFTGSLSTPTLYGYSGMTFPTITTTGNPSLEWTTSTGNPNGSPPTSAVSLSSGTSALGSIVLEPIPEPSTIALGGLAAAALLAFRRKK